MSEQPQIHPAIRRLSEFLDIPSSQLLSKHPEDDKCLSFDDLIACSRSGDVPQEMAAHLNSCMECSSIWAAMEPDLEQLRKFRAEVVPQTVSSTSSAIFGWKWVREASSTGLAYASLGATCALGLWLAYSTYPSVTDRRIDARSLPRAPQERQQPGHAWEQLALHSTLVEFKLTPTKPESKPSRVTVKAKFEEAPTQAADFSSASLVLASAVALNEQAGQVQMTSPQQSQSTSLLADVAAHPDMAPAIVGQFNAKGLGTAHFDDSTKTLKLAIGDEKLTFKITDILGYQEAFEQNSINGALLKNINVGQFVVSATPITFADHAYAANAIDMKPFRKQTKAVRELRLANPAVR